jgi:bifunctional DNase/RNase
LTVAGKFALIVATYEYEDEGLGRLTAPARDAESFAEVLRQRGVADFEVTTLINEPHHRVGAEISAFYRDRRSDDLTLLYFSGHGLKDDDGQLYLAATNTRRDSLIFSGISAENIDRAMERCISKQKVLILDCCYSGAYPMGARTKADTQVHTIERFQGRGRTVLTASDSTQYAFEGDRVEGQSSPSVFTGFLVAGIRDGSADLDGDGDIALDELYTYVHDRVAEVRPQQRPKRLDNIQGRIVIARNINWSLPSHLRRALDSPVAMDRLGAMEGLDHFFRVGNPAVRLHVRSEFARLAGDPSRQVSLAAEARLSAMDVGARPSEGSARINSPVALDPSRWELPLGPEMTLIGVRAEQVENGPSQPILLLKEKHGQRYLPIWIGTVEATAIALEQQGVVPAAPLTHDLFRDVLLSVGARIDFAFIQSLVDGTFITWMSVDGQRVRARPSDAMNLALRMGAPFYCSEAVLADAAILIPDEDVY